MSDTKIAWAEKTWNPVTGCSPISVGCANCYAKRMANRLKGRYGYDSKHPFQITLHPGKLHEPFGWKRPRKIFVCSMADLFHRDVPDYAIDAIMEVICLAKEHIFLLLTKRPERIMSYGLQSIPNLWLGVSCENQEWADKRIPLLCRIPAAVWFVSLEPLLGPIGLYNIRIPTIDQPDNRLIRDRYAEAYLNWVIVGCESGPHRRPCKLEWVHSIVEQCKAAGVSCYVKQVEIDGRVSHNPEEWPKELRIREYPGDTDNS